MVVVVVTIATDFVKGDAESAAPASPVGRIMLILTVYVIGSTNVRGYTTFPTEALYDSQVGVPRI